MTRDWRLLSSNWAEQGLQLCLLVIFGLIVVHAPLSVFVSSHWPAWQLIIKAWKELLMLLSLPLALLVGLRHRTVSRQLLNDRLVQLMLLYAGVHLLLAVLHPSSVQQLLSGLSIDLRYIAFFLLVYAVAQLHQRFWLRAVLVSAAGALLVLIFGILQIFVLPRDILAAIGYSKSTIAPYLTIDQNSHYVRINSTLRGPNPLGAYAMFTMVLSLSYLLFHPKLRRSPAVIAAGVIAALSPAVLWASYSRSALLAVPFALVTVVVIRYRHRLRLLPVLAVVGSALLISGTGLYSLRHTAFAQNVIGHHNPNDSSQQDSDQGHISSLLVGARKVARQPLGGGIGSTGSASLFSSAPLIIENQYLFVAHESGWLGLGLFMAILGLLAKHLWQRRNHWLATAMLASGLGLLIIGLLLPVWADDTVAMVWWGLAALAAALPVDARVRRVLS